MYLPLELWTLYTNELNIRYKNCIGCFTFAGGGRESKTNCANNLLLRHKFVCLCDMHNGDSFSSIGGALWFDKSKLPREKKSK